MTWLVGLAVVGYGLLVLVFFLIQYDFIWPSSRAHALESFGKMQQKSMQKTNKRQLVEHLVLGIVIVANHVTVSMTGIMCNKKKKK